MVRMIEIGGASRPITFNVNALINFEEMTGIDMSDPISRINVSRLKNIRALTYCGLKEGHREEKIDFKFTIEDVGAWLTEDNLDKVTNAFAKDNPLAPKGDSEEEDSDKKKLVGENSAP